MRGSVMFLQNTMKTKPFFHKTLSPHFFGTALLLGCTALAIGPSCKKKPAPEAPKPEPKKEEPKKEEVKTPVGRPKPASTGNEAPKQEQKRLSTDEAVKLTNKILAYVKETYSKGGKPNCEEVVQGLKLALWGAEEVAPINEKTIAPYSWLAYCAAKTNHWTTTIQVITDILRVNPDYEYAVLLPKAQIALGLYREAEKSLRALNDKYPTNPEVVQTYAMGRCKVEKWKFCGQNALAAKKLLEDYKKLDPAKRPLLVEEVSDIETDINIAVAESLYHLGNLRDSYNVMAEISANLKARIEKMNADGRDASELQETFDLI